MMNLIDRSSTEPWYFGYGFQGIVVLGTAPILIPLMVSQHLGAIHVGIVVAAFYVGELMAPLFGTIADRSGRFRMIYLGGFACLGIGLCLFSLTTNLWLWIGMAFLMGAGAAMSNTVSGMYIIEYRPKPEWDNRIGWLQTYYGTGQALGLGLAAVVQARAGLGMLLSGILMIPALLVGRRGLPRDRRPAKKENASPGRHSQKHPRHGMSLLSHYHRPSFKGLAKIVTEWESMFGLFILSWFLVMFGTWNLYNLYPLVMKHVYHISPGLSSLYYALAAGLGIAFYAVSGTLGRKIGETWVLTIGNMMSALSFAALAVLAYVNTPHRVWLVPLFFMLTPIAWSPLIVAGTALTARLAPMEEGEAMGIFNGSTALASVISALVAGWLAGSLGYQTVPVAAAALIVAGVLLSLPILVRAGRI